jgi:predicted transcriptional regulator
MAMRTVARVTARVVVVILLVSAASAPAVATFDEESTTTFDHHSFTGNAPVQHANDEFLNLASQPAERAVSAVSEESVLQINTPEQLERAAECGVQSLCESDEILPYLGFILSYSRYDNSDPLENDRRADVYEMITDSPGIYISKLSDEMTIHRSTVRYHVRVLEKEGLIAERVQQGKHRLFPVEKNDLSLIAALDHEATAAVLHALLRVEPASVSLLADELDRAPSTVSYHLTRLAEEELIVQERNGNTVLTRLPQNVREVLQSVATAGGMESTRRI